MNKKWIVYNKYTGKILRIVSGPESIYNAIIVEPSVEDVIEGSCDIDGYVVVNKKAILRVVMPVGIDKTDITADGISEVTISSINVGATLTVNSIDHGQVNDGKVEMTFDLSGQYIIKLSLFPYIDWEVIINAN